MQNYSKRSNKLTKKNICNVHHRTKLKDKTKGKIEQCRRIIFTLSTMAQGPDNNHHSFPQTKRFNHQWHFHFKKRSFTCVAHYTQDGPTNVRSSE